MLDTLLFRALGALPLSTRRMTASGGTIILSLRDAFYVGVNLLDAARVHVHAQIGQPWP